MKTLRKAEDFIEDKNSAQLFTETENIDYVEKAPLTMINRTFAATQPLVNSAGILKNDPFWEDMMAAIVNQRAELDGE